jgi:Uri superfamily endonuclease
MRVKRFYPIRSAERIETTLAHAIGAISDGVIPHFGASDAHENSHLFYFTTVPLRKKTFMNVIFNAWTFSLVQ